MLYLSNSECCVVLQSLGSATFLWSLNLDWTVNIMFVQCVEHLFLAVWACSNMITLIFFVLAGELCKVHQYPQSMLRNVFLCISLISLSVSDKWNMLSMFVSFVIFRVLKCSGSKYYSSVRIMGQYVIVRTVNPQTNLFQR